MQQVFIASVAALMTAAACADENALVRAELKPLEFLVGSCWKGVFPGETQTDIHCFELVYGGAHIRDRHVVSGGPELYQGETIYSWNATTREIFYTYWNSFGGVSTGTATPRDGSIVFPDETYGGSDGESVTISSVWENIDAVSYESLSVETYQDGEKKERRVRYEKHPFTSDPLQAM